MRIEIEIPKEFEDDYNADRFKDFFERVLAEIIYSDGCCENYEEETAQMLKKAFAESKIAYDVEKVVAELIVLHNTDCKDIECKGWNCDKCFENRVKEFVQNGGKEE